VAAHRYWQADLFSKPGKLPLELSEFQLLAAGVRVDAGATLTASAAPSTGSLAALSDDTLASSAQWAYPLYLGVALTWDFGATAGGWASVDDIRLGSTDVAARFLRQVRIRWSDDNVTWSDYYTFRQISWPGARSKTASVTKAQAIGTAVGVRQMFAEFEGANGATTFTDSSANTVTLTAVGAAQLSNVAPHHGTTSLLLNGTTDYLVLTPLAKLTSNTNQFSQWEFWFKASITGGDQTLYSWVSSSSYTQAIQILADGRIWFSLSGASVSGPPVADGQWHHLVVQHGQQASNPITSVASIYVDGELQGRFQAGSAFAVGVANVSAWIGAARTSSVATPFSFFSGYIKDVLFSVLPTPRYSTHFVPFVGVGAGPATIAVDLYQDNPLNQVNASTGRVLGLSAAPITVSKRPNLAARKDFVNTIRGAGIGRVAGTVKQLGTPNMAVRRLVRLEREEDGLQIAEQWSNPITGAYSFDWIDESYAYTVKAWDYTHNQRAVIADNLTPDLIGPAPVAIAPAVLLRGGATSAPFNSGAGNMQHSGAVRDGDLAVAVITSTQAIQTQQLPLWTLVATFPAGGTRVAYVYTRRLSKSDAGQAESVSFNGAGLQNITTAALYQPDGKLPFFDQVQSTVLNGTANQALALPNITTRTGESYALAVLSTVAVNTTPTTTDFSIAGGGWAPVWNNSYDQLRLSVFGKQLVDTPSTTAGTMNVNQTTAVNTNSLGAGVLIFKPGTGL